MDYDRLIRAAILRDTPESLQDAFDMARELEEAGMVEVGGVGKRDRPVKVHNEGNFSRAHEWSKAIRAGANRMVKDGVEVDRMLDLYYKTHLFDAPYFFDSFCVYIEKDRAPEKQFYLPRRKQLLRCVQSIQDLEDGKIHTLGISLAPGVGKTTIAEFGLAWTSGRNPFLPNLIGSHNTAFLTGMYGEMLRIFDAQGEYRWGDVFPGLSVIATNAKDLMIGIGYTKSDDMRFKTLQWGSLFSQLAGRVRAANWMYLDDPVDGIETAMSRERLDKLWQTVYTDFFQRSIGNRTRRLVIGTRWSLVDPIGRLEDFYAGDPGARFIREPALDEETDESRFDYPYGLGYTTEELHKIREMWDEPSFAAIYQQQPIEREGQLYAPEELRRYFDLPDKEPDTVLALCDTKEQGADYCVCPIFYQYGNDFYMDAVICDNGKVESVQERVAQILVDRKVKMCRIESNRGGTIFAQNVQKRVRELGGMTSITTKWTQTNKETRIQVNSAMVKAHVLFLDDGAEKYTKEYRTAMTQLTTYSMVGKNKNDDVPDALAMFVDWRMSDKTNIATVMKRPF